ncbi:MAG: peptidase [Castellaniella sp.]|uniref:murein hydrolase activator EnvC family protein n=1 Tax=Castellaniella sp. TaxID=1955812 RepID=UPI00120538BB|nr:peptidoglycan DD-metalloendopeptidase family protein [Castellaniella sp.]TAN28232.1 MAG: peptidase [Castellaniella sp.]
MRCTGLGLALCLIGVMAQAEPSLQSRQEHAQQDRTALRGQIDALQKRIEATESDKADATAALQASEQSISDITRRLNDLQQRNDALQASLKQLKAAETQQTVELQHQQKALADQLRAQYASGLSPWAALLSGRDPQAIGRELAYLSYVARARTQALGDLKQTLDKLDSLHRQTNAQQKELAGLVADRQAEKKDLQAQQDAHRKALAEVQSKLQGETQQAKSLHERDARLGTLIQGLDAEIAQAEARRKAALKAEAERKARERAEQARRARQQRAQAAEEARRIREQAERARAKGQAENPPAQAAPTQAPEHPSKSESGTTPEGKVPEAGSTPPRAVPPGGFPGLKKGLPRPVAGDIQGRFGTQRPEGGVWRGIVLRAPAGTPVRAVAAGRVVYAHWLSGFGNILIIDHGQQYLSIYAYNQALLKQVGDVVAQGDVVARVGATGGQVEPGLYFELRHQGAPINPEIWLRP